MRCTSSASRPSPCTRRPTRTPRTCAWRTARSSSGRPRRESYLRIPSVVAAAQTTGCDAVHPGWGFLAENPAFALACEDNDLVFVGPTPDVMARMGDKAQAKREMRAAGVPLVPGTDGTATIEQARASAVELGFPVLLKAASGGGGKGMRLVHSVEELDDAFGAAAAEAQAAFGDPSLYVEKAVNPARHVEIQVLADAHGGVLTLGERECSIQRRHQKLIEESPSPALVTRRARGDGGRRGARRALRSATATPARSSSSSGPTARSTSSS